MKPYAPIKLTYDIKRGIFTLIQKDNQIILSEKELFKLEKRADKLAEIAYKEANK